MDVQTSRSASRGRGGGAPERWGEPSLVERLRRRDDEAVRELDARYGGRIYRLAYRYLRSREDAEEVRQDVLLKVVCRVGAFRGDAQLSSWIYRIAVNTTMSRLRPKAALARHRRSSWPGKETEAAQRGGSGLGRTGSREPVDWAPLADEGVFRREFRRQLARALAELPPVYRTPVLLRDLRGLSTEEASDLLRIKPQTLKSRLHRGRTVLRRKLGAFAGGLRLHARPDGLLEGRVLAGRQGVLPTGPSPATLSPDDGNRFRA